MVRLPPPPNEKPLHWVSSSKNDLRAFLRSVQSNMGHAPGVAQLGGKHPGAKSWKGEGPGVFEAVEDCKGDTFRVVYTVRLPQAVYVLHAFQKKSRSGIKTAKTDVDLVGERLKSAIAHHEMNYVAQPAKGKDHE